MPPDAPGAGAPAVGPVLLDGVRVVELGDDVAGAAAGHVLLSAGASVTKVRDRRAPWRRFRPTTAGRPPESLLSIVLDDGKTVLDAGTPDADGLDTDDVDIVICDRVGGPPAGFPADPGEYLEHVRGRPAGAWVTISACGLQGPRAGWRGTELTVGASSGLLNAVRDPSMGRPVKLAGNQSLLAAGHAAALAALHALDVSRRRSRGAHADLSAQEAALAIGPVLQLALELLNSGGDGGERRFGAPAGMFPTRDGVVRISAMEDHQWRGIAESLGRRDLVDKYPTPGDRVDHAEEINASIAELTSQLGKVECERRLQAAGVPCTAVYTMGELLDNEQFAARGVWRTTAAGDGRRLRSIGAPFQVTLGAEGRAEASPGLDGLKVLELSHVLAAPLAGSLLGAMGARVIKLEDPDRLDMYRRRPPYVDHLPGVNRSAYFSLMNHSKRSLTLDMDRDRPGLQALLGEADAVVENLGPGRARKFGVDMATLLSEQGHLLGLSSSGFGHLGPWSAYRIYAYNLHASCGPTYLTRTSTGDPAAIDMAWADLITGYALATVVAAWAVGPQRGRGVGVDFAMAELVTARFNEFLAAESIGEDGGPEDGTSRQYPFAPSGLLPTAGGRWMAVAVTDDLGWAALRTVLGDPADLYDPRYRTQEQRWAHVDELEATLAGLVAGADAAELSRRLQEVGVAASPVLTAPDLVADEHLAARGLWALVQHPEWGPYRIIGLPWQVVGDGPTALGPPPVLGELDDAVAAGGRPFDAAARRPSA